MCYFAHVYTSCFRCVLSSFESKSPLCEVVTQERVSLLLSSLLTCLHTLWKYKNRSLSQECNTESRLLITSLLLTLHSSHHLPSLYLTLIHILSLMEC